MTYLNDNAVLAENLQNLIDINKQLKELVERYKPEISIDLNFDNRSIDASIKQMGGVHYYSMNKQEIDYYSVEDKISIFAEELSKLCIDGIKQEIAEKMYAIQKNIDTLKGASK